MNPNSALIWLPIIEKLGIKSLKTKIIPYNHADIVNYLEGGKSKTIEQLTGQIINACEEIGWPCFIRTDLSSCKHNGPDDYLAKDISNVRWVILRTVEDNEMKFWFAGPPPLSILVREFLYLDAPFKAFHNHPIAREWRFFVNENDLICFHPYWPHFAIQNPTSEDWSEKLFLLYKIPFEILSLKDIAINIVKELHGEWSVDFAMDIKGEWWLIDMATMNDSWHWPKCPNARKEKSIEPVEA